MIGPLAYLTADFAARVLPPRAAHRIARALARVAFAMRLPARRRLEANLALLLRAGPGGAESVPGLSDRARAAFEHFAVCLADFLRLGHMRPEALSARVEVRGREHLDAARASGRGVIVLSAHVGNWEWGAAYLATLGEALHVAARAHPSPWVDAFFTRRRRHWGVLPLRGRPLWLAAARALRRREWVALLGDRPASAGRGRAPGSPCAWAAALSRRTGALVLPAVMLRLADGRYAACFEPPLAPGTCRDGGTREAMRRCLEWDPAQWFAFEPLPEGLA